MQKFRKKEVEVKAIQLFIGSYFHCDGFQVLDAIHAVTEMLRDAKKCVFSIGIDPADNKFKISTYDEVMVVNAADWIVIGSKGEIGIVKDEIFKIAYDVPVVKEEVNGQ